jgi:hypothetical protein
MTNKEQAEAYRLKQAQKLLDVFEEMNGRPAATPEELNNWAGSPQGRAALSEHKGNDGKIAL